MSYENYYRRMNLSWWIVWAVPLYGISPALFDPRKHLQNVLIQMRRRLIKMKLQEQPAENNEPKYLPGYPLYPFDEDIYNQFKKEEGADPENILQLKTPNDSEGIRNEKDFNEDTMGTESDDPQEAI